MTMRIILRASPPSVRALLAEVLEPLTPELTLLDTPVFAAGIRCGSAVSRATRDAIETRLSPLGLTCSEDASIDAETVDIAVVAPAGLAQVNVHVHTDCPVLARRISAALAPFCRLTPAVKVPLGTRDIGVQYGGAPSFLRGLARLAGGTGKTPLPEKKAWGESDMDISIYARSASRPVLPIELLTDDVERAEGLARDLRSAGFPDVRVAPMDEAEREANMFAILPGALISRPEEDTLGRVQFLTTQALTAAGVDPDLWPLKVAGPGTLPVALRAALGRRLHTPEFLHVRVILPFAACARGALRPYHGAARARFAVTVRSDDASVAEGTVNALREAGFPDVTASPLTEDDYEMSLQMEYLSSESEALEHVHATLARVLPEGHTPVDRAVVGLEHKVIVVLPMHLTEADLAARARARRGACNVYVLSSRGEMNPLAQQVRADLKEAGFRRIRVRSEAEGPVGVIHYGGADVDAIGALMAILERRGVPVEEAERVWGPGDMDISVRVPDGAPERAARAAPTTDPFADWEGRPERSRARVPFIDVGQLRLTVGGTRLRYADGGASSTPAGFESYVTDATTATTLAHLAVSVQRREPVLLEGPTCTSKTSVILYLAALLGQGVVRINLSAQTDTSELLGRYLPTGGDGRAAWRWQDGRVVRALREGAWVIFDEINLAEPAVLERLNPLLEAIPGLVLTEHDGEVFGPDGTAIHPSFRVFATMNPVSYAGRCALSPALRDRFLGYRSVSVPTEADVRQMLERVVLGAGHSIAVEGREWAAPGGPPVTPWSAEGEPVHRVLRRLARLWTSLSGMGPGDGVAGGEGAVYTRRGLLAIVQAVGAATQAGEPLEDALRAALRRYVVGRVTAPTERVALAHVLDACGLGPGQWRPFGAPEPVRPANDDVAADVDVDVDEDEE
jgi:hypothetical protein